MDKIDLLQFGKTQLPNNISQQFKTFLIPQNLSGKTVYNFGYNIDLLLECVRRGATHVISLECDIENINLLNHLTEYSQINHKLLFDQMNNVDQILSTYGYPDLAFWYESDTYVQKEKIYQLIGKVTKNTCYCEINLQHDDENFKKLMTQYGFELIINIGQSKKNPTKQLYILIKNPVKLKGLNDIILEINGKLLLVNGIFYRLNDYVVSLYPREVHHHLKQIYDKIKDIKYVQQMIFYDQYMITPVYDNQLSQYYATDEEKKIIKSQLIDFIRQLNKKSIAHRDLHIGNVYFHQGTLRITNWIVACEDQCDINYCYDLTGYGEIGYYYSIPYMDPVRTYECVLRDNNSFKSFLGNTLKIDDFVDIKFQLYCAHHLQMTFGHYIRNEKCNNLGRCSFVPLHDVTKPCVFYGLSKPQDLEVFKSIQNYKIIIWTGGDIDINQSSNEERQQILSNISTISKCPNVYHIAISKYISDDLKSLDIPHKLVPIMSINLDEFKPIPKGNAIYVYIGTGDDYYGYSLYIDVYKKLRDHYRFIFATNPIYDAVHPKEIPDIIYSKKQDMCQIYSQCFIALKLTQHEGLSATTQELGCMGIKTVTNLDTPSTIPYKNVDDIIRNIEEEYKSVGTVDYELSNKVKNYLCVGDSWLFPEFYKS